MRAVIPHSAQQVDCAVSANPVAALRAALRGRGTTPAKPARYGSLQPAQHAAAACRAACRWACSKSRNLHGPPAPPCTCFHDEGGLPELRTLQCSDRRNKAACRSWCGNLRNKQPTGEDSLHQFWRQGVHGAQRSQAVGLVAVIHQGEGKPVGTCCHQLHAGLWLAFGSGRIAQLRTATGSAAVCSSCMH